MEPEGNNNNNNFQPKGPRRLVHKAKNALKNMRKRATNAFKAGTKMLWKAVVAKLAPILIIALIILVFIAVCMIAINELPMQELSSSVESYFASSNFSSKSEKAQEVFNETGSLILATDEDIKKISDDYLATLERKSDVLYEAMSQKNYIGSTKIKDIEYTKNLNITNAYEFILNSEKMNFNRIVWKEIDTRNKKVKDIKLKTDDITKLKYPDNDDDEKELEDFVRMVIPYLQSYIVPASMISGMASNNYGTRLGDFAYSIMDKAYHKIQINQYNIQNATKHKATTRYIEMDVSIGYHLVEDNGSFTLVYHINDLYDALDELESLYADRIVNSDEIDSYTVQTQATILDTNKYAERINDDSVVYVIAEAQTLKSYMSVDYEHKVYSEEDVQNFNNADAKSIVGVEDYNNKQQILADIAWQDSMSNMTVKYGVYEDTEIDGSYPFNVKFGKTVTEKFYWQDELKVNEIVTRNLDVDDVREFLTTGEIVQTERPHETFEEEENNAANNAEENEQHEENEEEQNRYILSASDNQYYDSLEKDGELNMIDIINSSPDIYNTYLQKGENFSENIGLSRRYLQQSYRLLEKYLSEMTTTIDYGTTLEELNDKLLGINLAGGIGLEFVWPLLSEGGIITSCAGERGAVMSGSGTEVHGAVDIAIEAGVPIIASQSGTVVRKRDNTATCIDKNGRKYICGYGLYIVIRHEGDPDNTYYTLYAHMSRFGEYEVGDEVEVGDVIGYVGSTGGSTGNHLHFEIQEQPKGNDWVPGSDVSYRDNLEPLKYILRSTIPEVILNQTSLPGNCGDMTPDMFGSQASTILSGNVNLTAKSPSSISVESINKEIDNMSDIEILARLAYGEQGYGSYESKVLVALSLLNRSKNSSVKTAAKATYGSGKHYHYNCIASYIGTSKATTGHFWADIPDDCVEAAEEAMNIFQNNEKYLVEGYVYDASKPSKLRAVTVDCSNVYSFKSTEIEGITLESLGQNWDNLKPLIILKNGTINETGFYAY